MCRRYLWMLHYLHCCCWYTNVLVFYHFLHLLAHPHHHRRSSSSHLQFMMTCKVCIGYRKYRKEKIPPQPHRFTRKTSRNIQLAVYQIASQIEKIRFAIVKGDFILMNCLLLISTNMALCQKLIVIFSVLRLWTLVFYISATLNDFIENVSGFEIYIFLCALVLIEIVR